MAESFLPKILDSTRRRVELAKARRPLSLDLLPAVRNRGFGKALAGPDIGLIAEIKKASPSKGPLNPDLDPAQLAQTYEQAGAVAISILTEPEFFLGDLSSIGQARKQIRLPILRKDFILDRYQILESIEAGADAVLLIAAALDDPTLLDLMTFCRQTGLETFVEVHDRRELERALDAGAKIIGINNRNLTTFEVNLDTTFDLLPHVPTGRILVSESGIHEAGQIRKLKNAGVQAVLIGQALVTADDPAEKIRELFADG